VLYFLAKENIGTLTLTGGEPTLVPDIIQRLRQYNIYPNDIWVCTNGYTFKKKWAEEYFKYWKQLPHADVSGFSVSTDCYHPDISKYNLKKYQELAEYYGLEVFAHNSHMRWDQIKTEGNGFTLGGIETCNRCCEWQQKEVEGDKLYDGYGERKVYITVDGEIAYGSMWSYKRISNLILGNITEHSLSYILENAEKKYRKVYAKYTAMNYDDLKWGKPGKRIVQ
jgi:MoaA/NifB/PqqE/SkfB family radical SAM enzyme